MRPLPRIYPLLLTLMCMLAPSMHAARTTAADILNRASQEIKKAGAIKASFTVSYDGRSTSGDITVAGNRFHLDTPDMTTWFDGKTQWSYSHQAEEVSVSEPTDEELQQINPFAIVETLRADYKGRRLTSADSQLKLELTPVRQTGYAKIVLTLNATTYMPVEITLTSADRSVTTVHINHLDKIKAPAASAFRFDQKKYPMAEVIDLR